jgi:aerobic-type carbon monoxide dehydrogenase small subunit (CoxS/CutS family)
MSERSLKLHVNGAERTVVASPDTPLLYVLRDELHLRGPRFGCGLAQCGACSVQLDGKPIRSCVTPVVAGVGHKIKTLEGLADAYYASHPKAAPVANGQTKLHPVQQAWVDEQVPHCGYCQNGWLMYSAALLEKNPRATDTEIRQALTGLKCRCGTHTAILRAVKRAGKAMA